MLWNFAEIMQKWLDDMRAQGADPSADDLVAMFRSMSGYEDDGTREYK